MIRVMKTEDRSRTIITVDGEVSSESVAVVETCCAQAESTGKPVKLFLRDIIAVDKAGQKLLRRLAAQGVQLAATDVYTAYLVQSLASSETASKHSPVENIGARG